MKSVLVIGMGRFGKHLSRKMQELGNDVMIIDKDEERVSEFASEFTDSQIGDCRVEGVLKSIGVNNFDICFVAIGEDFQSSLEITALLKDLNAKWVVTKASSDIQKKLLLRIGADEVVYPERDTAEKLAIRSNAKNIFDYIQLTDEYSIYEIPIINSWIGKTIIELAIRRKYKVNIIAVKNANSLDPVPSPLYTFKEGDHIIVIGKSSDVFKLTSLT
ncbi:TrkA family potassium uptake protein [Anaerofustis butyriciformans]|uniref:potassium channel family protein n=1 Tax=Anaerofustis butyriciformans TaxID=3108533 RepID=UPI002E368024|nr:TrkA family potassium uptake protein [Anaerofustis sp. HA2171]